MMALPKIIRGLRRLPNQLDSFSLRGAGDTGLIKFGLQNLRRLRHIEPVELRPITVLVGRNSSGKSSFLRALPLLRQSLMTRTSGPMLWYGDLVDFGSFEGSVRKNDLDQEITFRFVLDAAERPRAVTRRYLYSDIDESYFDNIDYTVNIYSRDGNTCIKSLSLFIPALHSTIFISVADGETISSIQANGFDFLTHSKDLHASIRTGSIAPSIVLYHNVKEQRRSIRVLDDMSEVISPQISHTIRAYLHKAMKYDTIKHLSDQILSYFPLSDNDLEGLKHSYNSSSWHSLVSSMQRGENDDLLNYLKAATVASHTTLFFDYVTSSIADIINSVSYIGPARARSERYYRYQDLAVSEIDPDGKNFAVFLNSLSTGERRSFSRWIEGLFGYGVTLTTQPGHISINIIDRERTTNIVDTGYGLSQVLPVLGQIWWAALMRRNRIPRNYRRTRPILAIEQPELHLHPAHQALLADALTGSVEGSTTGCSFVVETHSETLLNRLGELVAKGHISTRDVHVLLFDDDITDIDSTVVRTVTFGEDGELVDWPYGFFQPDPR